MNRKFLNFETDDSVVKYFKEVKKSKIITQEKELELALRIQNGDESATQELVKANLKFVITIAKEYQNKGLPLQDLINEGNYGLIKSISRFDHTKGYRFISYAVWWIRQAIMQSLNENSRVVRLPANVINKITKINKELNNFEHNNEREPVFGELVNGFDYSNSAVNFPRAISLNQTLSESGDELIETLVGEYKTIEDDENVMNINTELNKTLSLLDNREKLIIEYYFGINTEFAPMTLEEIGEKFGLTKERIRQIKEKAIRKLRNNSQDLQKILNE